MVYLMNYFFLPTYRWLWFWVIFFRCFSWTFENESEMNHLCNWGWDNHCTLLIRLLFVAKVNGGSLFPPIFQSLLLVTCLCIWIRIFCFFWALRWYCFLLQAFFFWQVFSPHFACNNIFMHTQCKNFFTWKYVKCDALCVSTIPWQLNITLFLH